MILVSACLLGQCTRYDGRHSLAPGLAELIGDQPHIALCPEFLAGLGIPRRPAHFVDARPGKEGDELLSGRVRLLNDQGRDVSALFRAGAHLAARLAYEAGVTQAYLKDRSPSCAWDPRGQNPGKGPRLGVFSALLRDMGVNLIEVRAQSLPRR